MNVVSRKKLVSHSFDKIHEQLSTMKMHIDSINDPEANDLLSKMESAVLGRMRKLRLHLDIPYDWHDRKMQEMAMNRRRVER